MNISFDFPLILTSLVLITGLISLIDILFFAAKRKKIGKKKSIFIDYSRSFFPILLIVLLIRSFLIQPYRVPTGSLMPTILPGDFIAVNQFAYGLRLPVVNYKIVNIGEPKHGDIALFRWPNNPKIIFVKRVVGIPGDHVVYRNKTLYVNGKVADQKLIGKTLDIEPDNTPVVVQKRLEDLLGVKHYIFVRESDGYIGTVDTVVPKNNYFMMGDNRDASDDSRYWGFVPEQNLIGKAFLVWMSWDSVKREIRWHRIGEKIH
ncbi:MAG: signal peptidase [Coxiella sp. DG_40]|nr:MAG: signal peptidase [Coxiella sp. DG_40]